MKCQKQLNRKKEMEIKNFQNSINVSVGQCQSETISGSS